MRLMILPLRSLPYPEPVVRWVYPLLYLVLIAAGLLLLRRAYQKAETIRKN